MDDLNPSGHSQPPKDAAYETANNPVSKEPAERAQGKENSVDSSKPVDVRVPSDQANGEEAMPTSVARGIRGAGPGEEAKGIFPYNTFLKGRISLLCRAPADCNFQASPKKISVAITSLTGSRWPLQAKEM